MFPPAKCNAVLVRALTIRPVALLLVILAVGIGLRLWVYLGQRSLWLDEVFVAESILNRTFFGLTQPLENGQIAPIGWLLLVKATSFITPSPELSLRIVPVISGIVSLFCAVTIFKKLGFYSLPERIIATALMCGLPILVYYSSEAKQYSTELAVTTIVTLLSLTLASLPRISPRWILAMILIGIISVTISMTACFVLFGCGIALLAHFYRKGGLSEAWKVSFISLIWLTFFATYMIYFFDFSSPNIIEARGTHWAGKFAPFPPHSFADISWYYSNYFRLFKVLFGQIDSENFQRHADIVSGVSGVLFVLGMASIYFRGKLVFAIMVCTMSASLFASMLKLYPFADRLSIFFALYLIVGVSSGIYSIVMYSLSLRRVIALMLIAVFLIPLNGLFYELSKSPPFAHMSINEALHFIRARLRANDVVYVTNDALAQVRFYMSCYAISGIKVIQGLSDNDAWEFFRDDIRALRHYNRIWMIFVREYSHNGYRVNLRVASQYYSKSFARLALSRDFHGATVRLIEVNSAPDATSSDYHGSVPSGYRAPHPGFAIHGPRTINVIDGSVLRDGDPFWRGACR